MDIRYFSAFRAEFLSTAGVDNVVGSVVDNFFYVDKSSFTALTNSALSLPRFTAEKKFVIVSFFQLLILS